MEKMKIWSKWKYGQSWLMTDHNLDHCYVSTGLLIWKKDKVQVAQQSEMFY